MSNLYDVLEMCLKELEQDQDLDAILARYTDIAQELRPVLEMALQAREKSVPEPSADAIRRNRTKVLQSASKMREQQAATIRRMWSVPFRRALVSLAVIVVLFMSGTGLVRAASVSLPGDGLYPVKRTWEGLSLFFTFNTEAREALELEHGNERLNELHELFTLGRSTEVEFSGYVSDQDGNEWRAAGITIYLSPETQLPEQQIQIGSAIHVRGFVRGNGVEASQIELLATGSIVPEVDDDNSPIEPVQTEAALQDGDETSGLESAIEPTKTVVIMTSTPGFHPEDIEIDGIITSIENNYIVVNGIVMNIENSEIIGAPGIGVVANVDGYYDANGVFIVTSVEFQNADLNNGNDSGDDSSFNQSNDNKSNDNVSDDDGNDVSNDNVSNDNESNDNESNSNSNDNDH